MSDDGHKEPQSVADALAQSDPSEQDDATVQISRAELAAIRESATNHPALSPEVLREINQRRKAQPEEFDEPTQTFDRSNLTSLLEQGSSPAEEADALADDALAAAAVHKARQDACAQPDDALALSDDDLGEVFDAAFDDDIDDIDGLGEFSDADLHAVVFGDGDSEASNAIPLDELSEPDEVSLLDDEEFDALEELADESDDLLTAEPVAAQPVEPAGVQPPANPPGLLDDDELVTDFRGAESRLLMVGSVTGGLLMLAAGVARLGFGALSWIHASVAGTLGVVGLLVLMGALVSFLQRR